MRIQGEGVEKDVGGMEGAHRRGWVTDRRSLSKVADCPAVSLDLCIYTAGGGNPLYREELLKQCSSVKNKAIRLISLQNWNLTCIRST